MGLDLYGVFGGGLYLDCDPNNEKQNLHPSTCCTVHLMPLTFECNFVILGSISKYSLNLQFTDYLPTVDLLKLLAFRRDEGLKAFPENWP